ncbi:uncharacterized protein LOC130691042 [Daphnia carinata]|uniref:uncharacterized protein LOC130691042 n=1 Tax=Daphnia carinata TaxID=120202 RepID=UPI00257CAE47|nr:uncharacterized protein LOC130691042 [Daphnia carinata]
MAFNTSFPSPKPLPGSKKAFPHVSARVNSFTGRKSVSKLPDTSVPAAPAKPGKDSRKIDPAVGHQKRSVPANVSHANKIRTHHDSSAVSACLKTATATRTQKVHVKSTAPVQKPDITTSRTAGQAKPVKPETMDRTDKLFAMKPLPGKKKTLEDFVRKPFRANPVPLSTYKHPKDCSAVKQEPHPPAKKVMVQTSPPQKVKPVPFRARPLPASTYSPSIHPGRKIHKVQIEKTDESVVTMDKPDVDNDVKVSEPIDEPASSEAEAIHLPPVKKIVVQTSPPEKVKPVPFRARPVPASTYVPSIQPAARKIHKAKIEKTDESVVPVDEPAVDNDVKISEPIHEPASGEPETVSGPNGPEVEAAAL